jgi:outer membrane protein OmpA-like peptidoglycan-associated protein/tetratricopeptide (TPR) repeat protein
MRLQINKILICLVALVFLLQNSNAQEYSTKSKKSIKLYEEAAQKIQVYDYLEAINILVKVTTNDATFIEAWLLLADAYDSNGNKEKVVECCRNAIKNGADKYPVAYFFLCEALYKIGNYQDALSNSNIFLSKKQITANQKKSIDKINLNCHFAINAIQHPVPFAPIDLGSNINTKFDEYWPSISADGEMMVFTRLIPKNENNPKVFGNRQEDLFYSVFKDNQWQKAEPFGNPINTSDNEGAQFITSDGKKMYFTACNRADGKGKCDIYVSEKLEKGWSVPVNMGEPINSAYSEKQPSLSSDGNELYFASNRPGGKGNLDIWVSTLDEKGKWSKPVNLGDSINTPEDEQAPFIHPDNHTLYFASNGWPGMGGNDLFFSRRINNMDWSSPKNLGYPINTYADEVGIIVNTKGDRAYFASNREASKGRDIYEFELYSEARPILVSYVKGKVFDSDTKEPVDAKFELIDLKSAKTINHEFANKYTGEFLVCIPTDMDYALNVSKEGYLFYSENFTLSGISDKSKPFLKDIPLQQIKEGNKVVLKNIFFETNSFELKEESTVELEKLIKFLNKNVSLKIEIGGHSDNVGSDETNQKLSENRAKSVVGYLVSKGISPSRLTTKGYGKSEPVADNKNEEGRSQNRRTEFKIVKN